MSDKITLPLDKDPGGSDWGIHYWQSFDKCPRKRAIGRAKDDNALLNNDPERFPIGWRVGQLTHQLQWAYQTEQWPDGYAVREDDYDPEWKEATRLFAEYVKHYPPREFNPVGLEDAFYFDGEDALENFGVPYFTGRWDAVPLFDEETLAMFEARREVTLNGPGIYILDTKTEKSKPGNLVLKAHESEQMWAYMMAWNILHPSMPCRGAIWNHIAKHNAQATKDKQEKKGERPTGLHKDSFSTIFIDYPTEEHEEILRDNMRRRADLRERYGDRPNLAWCFNMGTCPYLEGGACDRQSDPATDFVGIR